MRYTHNESSTATANNSTGVDGEDFAWRKAGGDPAKVEFVAFPF